MLRDLQRGGDPQLDAVLGILAEVRPDILVLTDFDYDLDGFALSVFQSALQTAGWSLDYSFALAPNVGLMTDLDLDQDGRLYTPRDAQGFGYFRGNGGMAILSRWPFGAVWSWSDVLWKDVPGAAPPTGWPEHVMAVQRLSSNGHWAVPVDTPAGTLTLLAFAATSPVFDGPEDRNGLRGADEVRFWETVLDGHWGAVPEGPFVVGKANIDPVDGDGLQDAIGSLLSHAALQDPQPRSIGGKLAADVDHFGDPALDTAHWPGSEQGNLRVSYILAPADWTVTGAGVFWPAPEDPLAALLGSDGQAAGPHRLVWVDVRR